MNQDFWQQQWQLHGHNFQEGCVCIGTELIPELTKTIRLLPGPGFGDLSHPTTHLMVEMLRGHVEDKVILDIGCGSGVLSLIAIGLGATKVIGVDVDETAIEHAKRNAEENGMEKESHFQHVDEILPLNSFDLALMNMISSEQLLAWTVTFPLKIGEVMTSGILKEEEVDYLNLWAERGGAPQCRLEREGWLGFHMGRESNALPEGKG